MELTVTTPLRQNLVDILAAHPHGISRGQVLEALYPEEKPALNLVSVLVYQTNKELRPQGWHISSDGRRHDNRYHLTQINAPSAG